MARSGEYNPSMNFDLRELEIFCAVVEQQSFTRAAAEVHLAQASVSERIAGLEQSVGAELLHRSTRKVSPTAVGQRLYEGAQRLLAERRSVINDLSDVLNVRSGELVIGASTIPGEFLLPSHLASFSASHPDVLMRVHIGGSERIAEQVSSGAYEIGVVSSGLDHQDLVAKPLWDDELVLATPVDHRWSGRKSIKPDELCGEPFIQREPGSGTRLAFEKAIAGALAGGSASLKVVAELGSTTAVKEAVLLGLGVSILSSRAVKREIAGRSIFTCRLDGVDLSRTIVLIHHRKLTLSPAATRFVKHLVTITRPQSENPNPTS